MKYHTFLPKFHPLILARAKQTTIRGRTLVKPGETFALRHWTGKAYRSPMGVLGTATCQSVQTISVYEEGYGIYIDSLPVADPDAVARRDGFACAAAMRDHFIATCGLPFTKVLITWGDTFQPAGA